MFTLHHLSTADHDVVLPFIHLVISRRTSYGRSLKFRCRRAGAKVQRNITTPSRDINTKPRDNSTQHNVNVAATEIDETIYRNDRRVNRFCSKCHCMIKPEQLSFHHRATTCFRTITHRRTIITVHRQTMVHRPTFHHRLTILC